MSDARRVFITGLSALTASGDTLEDTWTSIMEGFDGFDEIKQWPLSSAWPYRLGGELKSFQPAKMLPDRKLAKVISRQDVFGINAAMQAVEHSRLMVDRAVLNEEALQDFNESTGVFVGSPGNKYYQQYDFLPLMAKTGNDMKRFATELFSEVHPMWLLRILPNNVLAYTGITYGFKGTNHNIANHAVSGMQAVIEAYHAIRTGQIERAVVVAYDVGTDPQALFYYGKLGVLSDRHLKPFDRGHDGTILAEGAAAMVIESEASALSRSARCYAEMIGGASASEAAGLFSLEAEGARLGTMLQETLNQATLLPSDIGMIVAHGNGNQKSDVSEAQAISAVFDKMSVPVTAFKWSMGHTICASGLLDTVLAAYALEQQCIPGIANFEQAASGCTALNLSREKQSLKDDQAYAMVINRGYASMNACLILKRCDE